MSFRFVHTADLHLDSPFRGMARLSPDAADALVEAALGIESRASKSAKPRDAKRKPR